MIDVSEAFEEFLETYNGNRFVITNGYAGEIKVATPFEFIAYIHPDDYKKDVYNAQGVRLEDRVKIFCDVTTDLLNDDEIEYQGRNFKVNALNKKIVGNFMKLTAELIIWQI